MKKVIEFFKYHLNEVVYLFIGASVGAASLWLYLNSLNWIDLLRFFDKSII